MSEAAAAARLYCSGKTTVTVDELVRGEVANAVEVKPLVMVRS